MNLSSLVFVALTTLFSSSLVAQSNFNDLSVIDFTTHSSKKATSIESYDITTSNSINQIKDHLTHKFTYPADMRAYNIEGSSTVSFTLTKSGTIKDIVILESLGVEFDYEINRVLSSLNKIPPVKVNGKAISQKVVIPIQFEL